MDAPPPYNDTCALRFDELINRQDRSGLEPERRSST